MGKETLHAIEPIMTVDWEPQAAQSDIIDKINEIIEVVNQQSDYINQVREGARKLLASNEIIKANFCEPLTERSERKLAQGREHND